MRNKVLETNYKDLPQYGIEKNILYKFDKYRDLREKEGLPKTLTRIVNLAVELSEHIVEPYLSARALNFLAQDAVDVLETRKPKITINERYASFWRLAAEAGLFVGNYELSYKAIDIAQKIYGYDDASADFTRLAVCYGLKKYDEIKQMLSQGKIRPNWMSHRLSELNFDEPDKLPSLISLFREIDLISYEGVLSDSHESDKSVMSATFLFGAHLKSMGIARGSCNVQELVDCGLFDKFVEDDGFIHTTLNYRKKKIPFVFRMNTNALTNFSPSHIKGMLLAFDAANAKHNFGALKLLVMDIDGELSAQFANSKELIPLDLREWISGCFFGKDPFALIKKYKNDEELFVINKVYDKEFENSSHKLPALRTRDEILAIAKHYLSVKDKNLKTPKWAVSLAEMHVANIKQTDINSEVLEVQMQIKYEQARYRAATTLMLMRKHLALGSAPVWLNLIGAENFNKFDGICKDESFEDYATNVADTFKDLSLDIYQEAQKDTKTYKLERLFFAVFGPRFIDSFPVAVKFDSNSKLQIYFSFRNKLEALMLYYLTNKIKKNWDAKTHEIIELNVGLPGRAQDYLLKKINKSAFFNGGNFDEVLANIEWTNEGYLIKAIARANVPKEINHIKMQGKSIDELFNEAITQQVLTYVPELLRAMYGVRVELVEGLKKNEKAIFLKEIEKEAYLINEGAKKATIESYISSTELLKPKKGELLAHKFSVVNSAFPELSTSVEQEGLLASVASFARNWGISPIYVYFKKTGNKAKDEEMAKKIANEAEHLEFDARSVGVCYGDEFVFVEILVFGKYSLGWQYELFETVNPNDEFQVGWDFIE